MSSRYEVKKGRGSTAKKNKRSSGKGSIFSFRPTAAQAKEMRGEEYTLPDLFRELELAITERDLKVTFKYYSSGESYVVTATEDEVPFGTARSLAVWHKDVRMALLGIIYALRTVYPDFPKMEWPPARYSSDW